MSIKTDKTYLCGHPSMIKAGFKMLEMLGVSEDMIAYDEF